MFTLQGWIVFEAQKVENPESIAFKLFTIGLQFVDNVDNFLCHSISSFAALLNRSHSYMLSGADDIFEAKYVNSFCESIYQTLYQNIQQ